jgi:hypothetical protein
VLCPGMCGHVVQGGRAGSSIGAKLSDCNVNEGTVISIWLLITAFVINVL